MPLKTFRKKMVCQVCHSKETTELIVEYLQERIGNNETLTLESPLFATRTGKFMSKAAFSRSFINLNPRIREEEINKIKNKLDYGIITQEQYDKFVSNIPYFHAHALRSFFISQITKGGNSSINLVMESHRSDVKTHKNYIRFTEEEIVEYYDTIEHYLTFNKKPLSDDEREQMKIEVEEKVRNELQEELASKDKQIEDLKSQIDNLGIRMDKVEQQPQISFEQIKYDLIEFFMNHNIHDSFIESKLTQFCEKQAENGNYDKNKIEEWLNQIKIIDQLDSSEREQFEESVQNQHEDTKERIFNKNKNLALLGDIIKDMNIGEAMYDKIDFYVSRESNKLLTEEEIKDIIIKVMREDIDDDVDI